MEIEEIIIRATRFAASKVSNPSWRDDAVQEFCIAALDAKKRCKPEYNDTQKSNYILFRGMGAVKDLLRKLSKDWTEEQLHQREEVAARDYRREEDNTEESDLMEVIVLAFAELKDEHKAIVHPRLTKRKGFKEIGDEKGVTKQRAHHVFTAYKMRCLELKRIKERENQWGR
jgi:RNA polymerase sigma factor (sigma-70 family)